MAKETAISHGETLPDSNEQGREKGYTPESSLEIPDSQNSRDRNSSPVFSQLDPRRLKPHPRNSAIYGEDEDVTELISLIRDSEWVKPLVVTPTSTIISGHRRWKAVLALGWESIPVEVRHFPNELTELEALLLENASRFKTTEQKVREAEAWKEVERIKAKDRQGTRTDIRENFPRCDSECDTGRVRDFVARRVGLGSGRTYEKAASVVRAIDSLVEDTPEAASALRRVLNEQSIDAAHQLLKKQAEERAKILATLASGQAHTTKEAFAILQEQYRERQSDHEETQHSSRLSPSCWNCQHRGELIENHSFYCYRLGALSLIDKSADTRGAECNLWSYRGAKYDEAEYQTQPTDETFTLTLPAHLQPLIQDAARTKEVSVVDWVIRVLESEALATCSTTTCTRQLRRN